MASRGRRGSVSTRDDEPRREERAEQQAPSPQGPVLPPPPPVDYGVFMQGLVQAMQTQAHTQAALQARLEAKMKDFDAILGLDWLKEHYALEDYRRKRFVFRILGEDEFSHPLPRNVAGKLVISAMKAMRMVNKGCDAFLASVVIEQQKADPRLLELVGKAGIARDEDGVIRTQLASTWMDVHAESASTSMDANT
ncbi:hypothetical protein Taro_053969 [Colocasia esculenta]|uniref:Uncharacterized protein n=1 Tax=Colocasia esculenta TaxID=4460 RepID=A0A843XMN3_COLES|nr:hypothetical protein [Colocasia esculenta]